MKKSHFFLSKLASIFIFSLSISAQSGRKSEMPVAPPQTADQVQQASETGRRDNVKLLVSRGFENFIKDLNDNGRAGYRVEKTLAFGSKGLDQSYAAILRLNPSDKYEYDWLSSPNRKLLDLRLNYYAKQGFNFVNSFPITLCDNEKEEAENLNASVLSNFHFLKGNAFLLERKNGSTTQTREYKIFIGKLGPGKNPKETIQAALDAAPVGFQPIKMLFSKEGFLDFNGLVLLEKDLTDDKSAKVEYRLIKEVSGFDKAVNTLAAQGFRFITGGRIGLVKFALMEKAASESALYSFIDDEKYGKDFDKTIAKGNHYYGIMPGELSCDSAEVVNQKLIFTLSSSDRTPEYRVFPSLDKKSPRQTVDMSVEVQQLMDQGFELKELFYANGLVAIFEK